MKVLIANTVESSGGAAKAASRLFFSLNGKINAQYCVQFRDSDNSKILGPKTKADKLYGLIRAYFDQAFVLFFAKKTLRYFSYSNLPTSYILKMIKEVKPDVLNLHWVQSGMLSLHELSKIKCPIVWTMHDSWVFTGGCHLPLDCKNFQQSCGNCPALGSESMNDLSHQIWKKKMSHFNRRNDVFVSPSSWLKQQALSSSLLKDKKVIKIENILDNSIFKPMDSIFSKKVFQIPDGKKIILFGAKNAIADQNKGFLYLASAAQFLNLDDVFFVFYGVAEPQDFYFKFPYRFIGEIKDDHAMAVLFNAADLVCVPSKSENLSYTIMEALRCSRPVVAFDVGGNGEMINHKINGYLAKAYDVNDFAEGMRFCLLEKSLKFIEKNSNEITSQQYIELFMQLSELKDD